MHRRENSQIAWVIAGLFLLVGCGSTPPTEFYTLNPLSASLQTAQTEVSRSDITIGVGPITLPEFLDRPQIVTRTTANRLNVDEFHRWGGSLQEDFARVLVENLSRLLATNRVSVYPSPEPLHLLYRIVIDVQQFDGHLGVGVTLNAVWTLLDENADKPLINKRFERFAPVTSSDYEALVAAHSTALAALSHELADAIRTHGQ
ncbi:MAG: membrane integrity-associated transporter subunit PqiC [Gammaproteobacteria bacterium]|nr:membrane integrity-associated transporter subunit PqiC [Gammaproteobacteria bacterium]MCP5197858.1 membrane integrity-associated transporter subunit PqiC [Gammaproteobacteria bacterium]